MFQSPFHSPTRTQGALASLLLCALIAGCGGDGGGDGGGVDDANTTPASSPPSISDTGLPPDSGPIDVLPAPEPRYDTRTHTLAGKFEFGQTHMVESKETRIAPSLSTGRNTMVLFTPTSAIPSSKPMFIEAIENGRSLGRYALKPPARAAAPFRREPTHAGGLAVLLGQGMERAGAGRLGARGCDAVRRL